MSKLIKICIWSKRRDPFEIDKYKHKVAVLICFAPCSETGSLEKFPGLHVGKQEGLNHVLKKLMYFLMTLANWHQDQFWNFTFPWVVYYQRRAIFWFLGTFVMPCVFYLYRVAMTKVWLLQIENLNSFELRAFDYKFQISWESIILWI